MNTCALAKVFITIPTKFKDRSSNTKPVDKIKKQSRQIAGKYPPLIPISMIRIERIEDIEKKRFFVQKHFLSPIYFDGIS